MTQGEWKIGMIKASPSPGIGSHQVAIETLCGDIPEQVIRILCCLVFLHVAIHAFHTPGFELKERCRGMAIQALGGIMRALEREAALPVNISYIFYEP